MGENSGISWTDHTFNPWHGCTKIAHPDGSGCDHCYAETSSVRWGRDIWGKDAERLQMSESTWRKPVKWNAEAEEAGTPAFVFCASMGDVFEPRLDLQPHRERLWRLIGETPWLAWLLLTKRPEYANSMVPKEWAGRWPDNVWAGTSVEHQASAKLRIPRLMEIPAARRFLSCEPLLGPIDFAPLGFRVDWVIVGGESGANRRVMDLPAFRSIVADCLAADVPVWTKQDSGTRSGSQGRIPDSLWIQQRPPAVVPV